MPDTCCYRSVDMVTMQWTFFVVLGMEPRASYMLGKRRTMSPAPQAQGMTSCGLLHQKYKSCVSSEARMSSWLQGVHIKII
jgi:hypothetical protein